MNYIIDEDTYRQFDEQGDYDNFLKDNSAFKDKNTYLYEIKDNGKNITEEKQKLEEKKQKLLEERHKKDEDYRYFMHVFWMEQYLPRFEEQYGEFSYPSDNLTNQQKCEALLKYYGDTCNITNIQDIFKRRPHKGFRH